MHETLPVVQRNGLDEVFMYITLSMSHEDMTWHMCMRAYVRACVRACVCAVVRLFVGKSCARSLRNVE